MINKPIDKIELDDLKQLCSNAVSEGKTIEYKEQLPSDSEADRREFLADISSFANASGGDLIFGIAAENGNPKSIDGVKIENIDETIRKYENIIRDGIDPRIVFATRAVNISDRNYVLIFRVNKSWIGPHRVIYKGHDKFYSRNSAGKYPLDTGELKIAFTSSQALNEQITKFKMERISQLVAGNFPLPFCDGAKIVLHLIPLESFTPNYHINLKPIIRGEIKLRPIYLSDWLTCQRINLEGILFYSGYSGDGNDKSHSYLQLYRNGIIEAVDGSMLNLEGGKKISPSYELGLSESLAGYLNLLKELGVNVPIIVFLTLIGVKDYEIEIDPRESLRIEPYATHYKIDREILQLPESVIETYGIESKDILRPMFDLIWNACGYERSYNFDEAGNWIAK